MTLTKRNFAAGLMAAAAMTLAAAGCAPAPALAAPAPAPSVDLPARSGDASVVLAGGCFWGVQGVFQHVKGVKSAVSGYAGGGAGTAKYDLVGTGSTGHAEAVRIVYDPKQISYGQILRIFFSVATDPTQLNRQYPDVGPQYRNAIFYADPEQKRVAQAYIGQLGAAKAFDKKIVTTLEPLKGFYPAEAYHQDYLTLHPDSGYIQSFDMPKIADLKKSFPQFYRAQPVLVGRRG